MADTYPTLGTQSSGFSEYGTATRRIFVPEVFEKKMRHQIQNDTFFSKFMGKKGEFSPLTVTDALKKEAGDNIKMPLLPFLDAEGRPGDLILVGNEEPVELAYQRVHVNQIRNATTTHGKMSDQRGIFKMLDLFQPALTQWWINQFDESLFWTIYYGYPAHINASVAYGGLAINTHIARPARYWYCADETNNSITYSSTDATYESAIETAEGTLANAETDLMSPSVISGICEKMRVLNIPQCNYNGIQGYIAILHPYQISQLRKHTDWFTAMCNAAARDEKNNLIFAGLHSGKYMGEWAGVHIFESNMIHDAYPTAKFTDSTTINGAGATQGPLIRRAIFLGAGAVLVARAAEPHFEFELRDYKNYKGIAVAGIYGAARADYVLDTSAATLYAQSVVVVSTYSPATVI